MAWAGLVVPLATLAFAAAKHVHGEGRRQQAERDVRLQQLAKIIYNKDGEFGLGAQILAVGELERFKRESWALDRYISMTHSDFQSVSAHPELINSLHELQRRIAK